jgi:HlyD family secretion protein
MKKSGGKRTVVLLLVIALGGAGGGYLWYRAKHQPDVKETTQIVEAKRGDLTVSVSATGTVEPEYTVEIKSKASGTIQSVKVQAGDRVEKGTLLVEIDPVLERRTLTKAEADLAVSAANRGSVASKVAYAEAQLKRDEELHAKGLVAREVIDSQKKELAVMKGDAQVSAANITKARASVAEARDRLSETKILAPAAGTILDRSVNPGQVITAGTAQGGQTLLTLADLSRLFIRVKVDEADVAKLKPGQSARITADALLGQKFSGKVLRVAPQGKVESNVTVFEVVVEVGKEGLGQLRPMLTANVVVQVDDVKGALLLPRRAVQQRGGKFFVNVEAKGEQPVEVGVADDRQIQIKSGLADGARVVVAAAARTKTPPGQQKTGGMGGPPGVGGGMGGMGGGGARP